MTSFWPENGPPFTRYNELDTFLRMSSFAWHAELACRKWLERGATFPGGLNTPKTTAWMSLLSCVNPPLDAGQEFGISPENEPEVSILRAYQLLLTGLSVAQVAIGCFSMPANDFRLLAEGAQNGKLNHHQSYVALHAQHTTPS